MANEHLLKRKECAKKIKEDLSLNQTKILLHAVYQVICLENKYENNKAILQKLKETAYSSLNNEELMKIFDEKTFNNLPIDKLSDLFQEVYNRKMQSEACEVRHIVDVKNSFISSDSLANIQDGYNSISVNKKLIDRFINTTNTQSIFNKNTIGAVSAMTILHETQHAIQSNKIVDYYLDLPQNKEDEFLGAVSLMYATLREYSYRHDAPVLLDMFENDYPFLYEEHNADYQAVKDYSDLTKNSKNSSNIKAIKKFTITGCHFKEDNMTEQNKKELINQRINKMEQTLITHLKYFNTHIKDSVLKEKITNTINSYINVKNNSSLFRKQLTNEINEMYELVLNAKNVEAKERSERFFQIG